MHLNKLRDIKRIGKEGDRFKFSSVGEVDQSSEDEGTQGDEEEK